MRFDRRSAERLRVLVVEPRAFVAARLKTQLEQLGHEVLGPARDGREALVASQTLLPSLILMETRLAGLDGINAARAIVTERPVPVILLTDYAGADLVQRAKEAGVVACLTSVDQPQLSSAIDVALERFGELRVLRREGNDLSEALATRRLVERAKKVLIARLGVSEGEAFQQILSRKLGTRRSLRETAWTIIDAEEALSRVDVPHALRQIFDAVRTEPRPSSGQALPSEPDLAMATRVDPRRTTGPML